MIVNISPQQALSSLDQNVFVKSRAFLRGSGIFSTIGSFLLPIATSVGRYLLSKGATFANETSRNILDGKRVKDSLRDGAKSVLADVTRDIKTKMTGGKSHKRPRKPTYIDIFARK